MGAFESQSFAAYESCTIVRLPKSQLIGSKEHLGGNTFKYMHPYDCQSKGKWL